jgi:hypothetical protein
MSSAGRLRDLADVMELIKILGSSREFMGGFYQRDALR